MDLFETPELLPQTVQELIAQADQDIEQGCSYAVCRKLQEQLAPLGYEFDYGLDGVPYDLRLVK